MEKEEELEGVMAVSAVGLESFLDLAMVDRRGDVAGG